MFQKLVALDRIAHRALRFNPNTGHGFAADVMAAPVVASEAGRIAREYVLVFSCQAESLPVALLGVQENRNAYVTSVGKWQARYVPAHVRRYPFMLADTATMSTEPGTRRFTVMMEAEASHFGANGESLFDSQGEPTALLLRVQETLVALQRDQIRTLKMVAQLEAAGVLVERELCATPKNSKPFAVEGMRMIDPLRFAALPADTLAELHRSGALGLAHAHFISLSNLEDAPLFKRKTEVEFGVLDNNGTLSMGAL